MASSTPPFDASSFFIFPMDDFPETEEAEKEQADKPTAFLFNTQRNITANTVRTARKAAAQGGPSTEEEAITAGEATMNPPRQGPAPKTEGGSGSAEQTAPSGKPSLRRDSLRPRTGSADGTAKDNTVVMLRSLNLLILAIAGLKKTGETPVEASTPARAQAIGRLVIFIRDAWTEETFNAELKKAEAQLPTIGAMDMVKTCIGLWLFQAVQVLRQGDLESDAKDLEGCCKGLEGGTGTAEATGAGSKEGERRKEEESKEAEDSKFRAKREQEMRETEEAKVRGRK